MEPVSGLNESLWMATTEAPPRPRFSGHDTVDVAIVGGGLTGLTTALLCKRGGARVAVLELGAVGQGVTGHTTAKLTSLHQLIYADLTSRLGEERARVYGQANEAAIDQIAALVDGYGIRCGFERRSAFTYTQHPEWVEAIEAEVEAAQRLRLPASFTTDTDLPFDVRAAVRFHDQAQFHPRAYVLGLADAVDGDGSAVYEGSRVTRVDDGSPCRVTTPGGTLQADAVVVATLLPFMDRGGYFAKAHPTRSYVLGLWPQSPPPRGMYITAESPTRSIRSHPVGDDAVLVVAGESQKPGASDDERAHWRALADWSEHAFAGATIDYRWSAQDYAPLDRMPYIGKLSRSSRAVWTATGFNKWGLTAGTAAGMLLSERILGRHHPWADTFDPNRTTLRASAGSFVRENATVARHFLRDRLHRPGREALGDLDAGQGMVVRLNGEAYAVSRDDAGALHTVSPVCTHLACHVRWNAAERSWDCPCHGSRFAPDGTLLQGPAVRDLQPKTLPTVR